MSNYFKEPKNMLGVAVLVVGAFILLKFVLPLLLRLIILGVFVFVGYYFYQKSK